MVPGTRSGCRARAPPWVPGFPGTTRQRVGRLTIGCGCGTEGSDPSASLGKTGSGDDEVCGNNGMGGYRIKSGKTMEGVTSTPTGRLVSERGCELRCGLIPPCHATADFRTTTGILYLPFHRTGYSNPDPACAPTGPPINMPRQTEPNANNALGSLLQDMMPRGQVRSENTQAISGKPGLLNPTYEESRHG